VLFAKHRDVFKIYAVIPITFTSILLILLVFSFDETESKFPPAKDNAGISIKWAGETLSMKNLHKVSTNGRRVSYSFEVFTLPPSPLLQRGVTVSVSSSVLGRNYHLQGASCRKRNMKKIIINSEQVQSSLSGGEGTEGEVIFAGCTRHKRQ